MAEDRQDVPYQAEWVTNLQHRPDPNRVRSLQLPVAGHESVAAARDSLPPSPGAEFIRPTLSPGARESDPQSNPAEPSYYDISMLKQPLWKWEIAAYFYLGGISAGSYLLARIAGRAGYRKLSRVAAYLAMAAFVPCPPLLIHDLGDAKRFHHMLRVFKPGSPMSVGTWTIMAYSGSATLEVVRQYLTDPANQITPVKRGKLEKLMNSGVVLAVHDAAGIPSALMLAGYTGILLSCTSNPLWCKNPWLGPLFSASAISTGTEAVSLAMDLFSADDQGTQKVLQNLDSAAHAAELTCLKGFDKFAGEKGKPSREGNLRKHHLISLWGIIGAEILKRLPVQERYRKPVRMTASVLGLAAGFSLRWSMVMGGHAAAADPHLARLVGKKKGS